MVIEIDGSYGEGGGQVLRTSLSLSVLTGRPVHLRNVRAGRSTPGLAPQHLTVVRALARICTAEVRGGDLRSTDIVFRPQSPPQAGNYTFDVADAAENGSAGAVTLLAQALLLPLAFAADLSHVTLTGGTHVRWSPSFEYLVHVYLPTVRRLSLHAECELEAWGFYPAGGGQISMQVQPLDATGEGRTLMPVTLTERGRLKRVRGVAVASNLPSHIPQRMTDRARNLLDDLDATFDVTPKRVRGAGPGAGIFLVAEYEHTLAGFAAHGEKGKPSETVAEEACQQLQMYHETGAPVDEHLADQLLLPMALAAGRSVYRTAGISEHLRTNAHVVRQFIPATIELREADDTVTVDGAGLKPG